MQITNIHGRQILDSRGNPTVEAEVTIDSQWTGRAAVPSGASTGTHEALELRDNSKAYNGKSVYHAVQNINTEIAKTIVGMDPFQQTEIDQAMIELDGTPNKARLGANAILAVSLATARATAAANKLFLYEHLHDLAKLEEPVTLPIPLVNIVNGGAHANFSTDIQEFMIVPIKADSFSQALQMCVEVFAALKKNLKVAGYPTTVGDEGGFAPIFKNGNTEAMDHILQAIENAGYNPGEQIALALDVAASEFYNDGAYELAADDRKLNTNEMINWLSELVNQYPIVSIEDGLAEEDWDGWVQLNDQLGKRIQLVGDDLLVTNPEFLQKAIEKQAANAVLVKPNQIGTLTETIQTIKMAKQAGWHTIASHRSGETEDTTIADIAVGLATGQIKTGSVSRTDRVAKYNQLLRIEEELGDKAVLAHWKNFIWEH